MLEDLAELVQDSPSATNIAHAVTRLVSAGTVEVGAKLPTVREVARRLGVSAATVGDAWQMLIAHGLVETQGRRGSFIVDATPREPERPFRHVMGTNLQRDLSTGFPDRDLLPDLRPYLSIAASGSRYMGYSEQAVDPELAAALQEVLPAPPSPGDMMLSSDVITAMNEFFPLVGGFGDFVAVGEAEFAPYLDLLTRYGITPWGLAFDESGPTLESVDRALEHGVKALVLQPRVHNPTGVVTDRSRLREIACRCREADVFLFDIDYFGWLASAPEMSAASWAPEQTVHLRSFSKDIHPDIRVAVAAGAPRLIHRAHSRRIGGWRVSRINQDVLRLVLSEPGIRDHAAESKRRYDQRRAAFIAALGDKGIEVRSQDGFNMWVPVKNESVALIYLASRSVSAAPGSAFQFAADLSPHVRISIASIHEDDIDDVAGVIAVAARSRRSGFEPGPATVPAR